MADLNYMYRFGYSLIRLLFVNGKNFDGLCFIEMDKWKMRCLFSLFVFILLSQSEVKAQISDDIELFQQGVLLYTDDVIQGIGIQIFRDSIVEVVLSPNLKIVSKIYEIEEDSSKQNLTYFSKFDDGFVQINVGYSNCTTVDNLEMHYHNLVSNDYKYIVTCAKWIPDYRINDIWILTQINNERHVNDKFPKGFPRLEFLLRHYNIYGFDGVNEIQGSFEIYGRKIYLFPFRIVNDGASNVNIVLQDISNQSFDYEIRNNQLFLHNEKNTLVFSKTD